MAENKAFPISVKAIERAVHLSYAQAMLGSIYAASTGGMFLIGYALMLGTQTDPTSNVQIGMMSTIPMLCVGVQLLTAALVERGVSRRWLTLLASVLNVLGWAFIIVIPYVAAQAPTSMKVGELIAVITLNTLFANVAGNARGSWVGDLIPESYRGTFFGRLMMYGGIIGTVFALVEGGFLDRVKQQGVHAFSLLFAFGMLIGLINALLFAPQADVPITRKEGAGQFREYFIGTFRNRPLMMVMCYSLLWSLQAIAGPFYATYMIRDLNMPFLGVGVITAAMTITMLLASPFWGRIVDRYGCRPILVLCTLAIAPFPLVWIWMTNPDIIYRAIIPLNLLGGFLVAGISVALNTMVYKVTPSAGRSVQFAIYSIIVVLIAAPLPTIGGYLPNWLHSFWPQADLRATFYVCIPAMLLAAWAAHCIKEPDARRTRELVRNLPAHLRKPKTLQAE